jgi:hypothetical protein
MRFAAFVAGGYIPFIRHSLLEHLNNTIFFCLSLSCASFVFLHIVTHILAHYRFAITALYYLPTAPHRNVPKTILYNETDTERATKYMPH